MKNWLGHEIAPGVVVYRGARQGNSSSFKVGVVETVNETKGTARVAWKYTDSALHELVDRGQTWGNGSPKMDHVFVAYVPYRMDSKGSPGIDSLVVLPDYDLFRLEEIMKLREEWNERLKTNPMTKQEFLDRMEAL